MKLYVCTDHDSVWPTGVGSVVIAADEQEARQLLDAVLREHGLLNHEEAPYTLVEVDTSNAQALILADGDY